MREIMFSNHKKYGEMKSLITWILSSILLFVMLVSLISRKEHESAANYTCNITLEKTFFENSHFLIQLYGGPN